MYRITMEILKEKMVAVLNDELTFEEVSNWAGEIMQMDELGQVEIDPEANISTIFGLITFLAGIDMKQPTDEYLPGEYIYSKVDLENILRTEFPENSHDSKVGQ